MASVSKERQPPPGYPTEEEQVHQVVDEAQQNGEDDEESDRGISAGFRIGRSKPQSHQAGGYPGPVLYNPSRYHNPQGGYPAPVIYNPSRYDSSRSHGNHGYVHHPYDEENDYTVQQFTPYNNRPQQFYPQPAPPIRRGRYY